MKKRKKIVLAAISSLSVLTPAVFTVACNDDSSKENNVDTRQLQKAIVTAESYIKDSKYDSAKYKNSKFNLENSILSSKNALESKYKSQKYVDLKKKALEEAINIFLDQVKNVQDSIFEQDNNIQEITTVDRVLLNDIIAKANWFLSTYEKLLSKDNKDKIVKKYNEAYKSLIKVDPSVSKNEDMRRLAIDLDDLLRLGKDEVDFLQKAQQAYDAIVNDVNSKLTGHKYDGLKATFEAKNQPNKAIRDTVQADKQQWAKDIKEATPKAQAIANKINLVKPKFDTLATKRDDAKAALAQIPVGTEYDTARNTLQNALDNNANKNEEIVKINPIDVQNWNNAIDNLDQALRDAKKQKDDVDLQKAQTAYDAIITGVNSELSDSKYSGLKATFEAENQTNKNIRETTKTDKAAWAKDINDNAIPNAQVIANKAKEAKQKLDSLESKRTEVQTALGKIPTDPEYQDARDTLQNALNADVNKNEEIVTHNPITIADWDTAINNLEQALQTAKAQKEAGDLQKAKNEFKTKVQDVIDKLKHSQETNSLNGDNELELINSTDDLLNSDIEHMTKDQINNLNTRIQAKIDDFITKSKAEKEYWNNKFTDDEIQAGNKNNIVTIKNMTEEDENSLLWTVNNNDMHPKDNYGLHPNNKGTPYENNRYHIDSPAQYIKHYHNKPSKKYQDDGLQDLIDKTKQFGNDITKKLSDAAIDDATELDKFMNKTLSRSVEEMNVLASMIVRSPALEFEKNTVLVKYLRRYYGSELTNNQYGLWSELASHKLVPTFETFNGTNNPAVTRFAARFNTYSIINEESITVPVTTNNQKLKVGIVEPESLDTAWIWKRSLAGVYRYHYSFPSYVITWVVLQDGVYPIFEKSLDYVLDTYKYLKPKNLLVKRQKLMQGKSNSEKLIIAKALATAKIKFTNALKNIKDNLENGNSLIETTEHDDSYYNTKIAEYKSEINTQLSRTDIGESAKKYLRQQKDYIFNQHDSSAKPAYKAYTLKHALENFKTIIDKNNSDLIKNENESILDPRNMNEVIEAYAILVELTHKYATDSADIIEWKEATKAWKNWIGPEDSTNVAATYNKGKHWSTNIKPGDTISEAEKFKDYAAYESSKYIFKKNVIQKLDFVNRKLLTEYSSDDQSNIREQLQAEYNAWVQTYNEISNYGDDEARYQTLLQTIKTGYKAVVNKDLSIL